MVGVGTFWASNHIRCFLLPSWDDLSSLRPNVCILVYRKDCVISSTFDLSTYRWMYAAFEMPSLLDIAESDMAAPSFIQCAIHKRGLWFSLELMSPWATCLCLEKGIVSASTAGETPKKYPKSYIQIFRMRQRYLGQNHVSKCGPVPSWRRPFPLSNCGDPAGSTGWTGITPTTALAPVSRPYLF